MTTSTYLQLMQALRLVLNSAPKCDCDEIRVLMAEIKAMTEKAALA